MPSSNASHSSRPLPPARLGGRLGPAAAARLPEEGPGGSPRALAAPEPAGLRKRALRRPGLPPCTSLPRGIALVGLPLIFSAVFSALPSRPWLRAQEGVPPATGEEAPTPPHLAPEPRPSLGSLEAVEPTPEALQMIRLFLSAHPGEARRGEELLLRLGAAVAPQLRYWVRKASVDGSRVEGLLRRIEGTAKGPVSLSRISAAEFFDAKLLEVDGLVRAGEYRQALTLAEALLLIDRTSPHSWDLRRLARKAKQKVVSAEVLEPGIDIGRRVYEAGERPEVTFWIRNHGDRPARIRLDRGLLGEFDLTTTRQGAGGRMSREVLKLQIELPSEVAQLVLKPGRTWEHKLTLPFSTDVPLSGVVVRVQLGGRFRPSHWTVDGPLESVGIPLGDEEFWVVPSGELALCDRPLDKLTAALVFGKPEAFFVGGQICVWAAEQDAEFHRKLMDTLVSGLGELEGERLEVAFRLLAQASGEDFGTDKDRWRLWWSKMTPRTE